MKANAVSQSFKMLVCCLPVIFGYVSDLYSGHYKMVCWGVLVCGIAHILIIATRAPSLLANNTAATPYMIYFTFLPSALVRNSSDLNGSLANR